LTTPQNLIYLHVSRGAKETMMETMKTADAQIVVADEPAGPWLGIDALIEAAKARGLEVEGAEGVDTPLYITLPSGRGWTPTGEGEDAVDRCVYRPVGDWLWIEEKQV
jgi:hypothetical protein